MEALATAASIVSIVDLAAKVLGAVYKFSISARGCKTIIGSLLEELTAVGTTLDGLRRRLADHRLEYSIRATGDPIPRISQLSMTLQDYEKTLGTILTKLESSFGNKVRSSMGMRLRWPLRETEVIVFISRLSRYRQTFELALQTDTAQVALEVETDARGAESSVEEVRAQQSKDIHNGGTQAQKEKLHALASWLSPVHYNVKHEESIERQQEETRDWLFEHKLYLDWERSQSTGLWIHGIPRVGKTILASSIIERIENEPSPNSRLVYFYCQYDKDEARTPSSIIRSLLAQLIWGLDGHSTEEVLERLISEHADGHGPPSNVKDLTDHFLRVSRLYQRSVVVIDGVDECPTTTRGDLLDFIVRVSMSEDIKVLTTSRKESDIEDELKIYPTICLEEAGFKEEKRRFITYEFKKTRKWRTRFQNMKDEFIKSLILGSGININAQAF